MNIYYTLLNVYEIYTWTIHSVYVWIYIFIEGIYMTIIFKILLGNNYWAQKECERIGGVHCSLSPQITPPTLPLEPWFSLQEAECFSPSRKHIPMMPFSSTVSRGFRTCLVPKLYKQFSNFSSYEITLWWSHLGLRVGLAQIIVSSYLSLVF